MYARCFLRVCFFASGKKKGKLLLSKCRVPVHKCITSMGPKNRVLSAACQTHLVPWDVGGIFIFFNDVLDNAIVLVEVLLYVLV